MTEKRGVFRHGVEKCSIKS